jgi:hypothetical protein
MIPKISRGSHPVGLFRYLIGPGKANEHRDPQLVAGSAELMRLAGGRRLTLSDATVLGRLVDEPRRQFGTSVTIVTRDVEGNVTGHKHAHVWHCPLSLRADEGQLADETWQRVAESFIARMGFVGERPAERCRWAAVRHGPSAGGNDHVHLVVGLVREDGEAAVVHNDRPRAQQACRELEVEFGLRQVEGRGRGAGERAYTQRELLSDRRRGRDVGEPGRWAPENGSRQTLERIVRAAATASFTEEQFVGVLRAEGVLVRARFAKGSREHAVGYSVALRPEPGEKPAWYPGGQLSRELTLPRLRAGWEPASGPVLAWQPARIRAVPGHRLSAPVSLEDAQRCVIDLSQLREQLRAVPFDDHGNWARVAGETAGVFAAWSVRTERRPGPLAAAARSLARSAQTRTPPAPRTRLPRTPTRQAAGLLLSAGGVGPSNRALLTQLANLAKAIHDMHAAGLQAQRAADLAAVVRAQLPAATAALTAPGALANPGPARGGPNVGPPDRDRGR